MTWPEILLGVVLGLLVNECCDVSPWAARRLVRWAARHRYANRTRAEIRAEEHAALVNDLPGKLFKLVTAVCFAGVAIAVSAVRATRRVVSRGQSGELPGGIAGWLLRQAARRLPDEYRERYEQEWAADLQELQQGGDTRQLAQWARRTRYAAELAVTAKQLGRILR